jgi:ubiquinone/menaquinone biosynthesis C-methylase UbiE
MSHFYRGFENVDGSADEQSFFQFLDLASRLPTLAKYRDRMLELCPITEGAFVLDVGCGLGNETTRLAARVGKEGRVNGIDSSDSLIKEAQRRAQGLDVLLHFQTGDAHGLRFEDSSFDVCRAERVLMYLEEPAKAIAEMARVTRSGGHVIIFDFDHRAFFIDSDFVPMTRHIEAMLADEPRNPLIGRELPYLMRSVKLNIDTIEQATLIPTLAIARWVYASTISKGIKAELFTAPNVQAWWQEQEAREREGTFYHSHPGYIVVASRP